MTCPRDAGNKNIHSHWLRTLPTPVSSSKSGTLKHLFPGKRGGASLRSVHHNKHARRTHSTRSRGWRRPPSRDGRGAEGVPLGPQEVPPEPAPGASRGAQSPRRTRARENWGHPGSLRVNRAVAIHSQCPDRPSSEELGSAGGASGPDTECQLSLSSGALSCSGLRRPGASVGAAGAAAPRPSLAHTAGPKQFAWPAALPAAEPDPGTEPHRFPLLPPPWAAAGPRAAGLGVCGCGLAGGGGARGGCCSRCPRPRRPSRPPAGALLWLGRCGPPAAEVAFRRRT